nr:hypothetical protein [Tanacetum cinerariifolium]
NTARPNSAVVNAVRANQVNAVKASTCWVWRPTKPNGASITLKRHNYIDVRGTIKTGNLDFEDVYFVKELKFNLFSVSQMCDRKNNVLFTDTECLVLSPNFKLPDESQILLRVPRKNNMYSVDMKDIVPKKSLTCIVKKDILDESMLWHRRLGHINFKNINKLVKDNLGHPQKVQEDQGYVDIGCSRHMTRNMSYLSDFKEFNGGYVTFREGMCDRKNNVLFTDTECLVLSPNFKLPDESQILLRVPRKNNMYSVDMKDIVPKKSLTCIVKKATLDESMLWHRRLGHINFKNINKLVKDNLAEAVTTACYVQNRVLVVKPPNKTSYKLFRGRTPTLSFMRPFGFLDYLGKFDGKYDKGFFVGYSLNSDGPKWLFDIDVLTKSMNYVPVVVDGSLFDYSSKNASNDEPQPSSDAGTKDGEGVSKESRISNQERPGTASPNVNTDGPSINTANTNDNAEVDLSNISTTYLVLSAPNTRIHKDHSLDHVIGDVQSGVQTRRMTKPTNKQGFISVVYKGKTHKNLNTCLFACFLSQIEPTRVAKALSDPAWVEGYTKEEGIDYDEVFAQVARIEEIRLFLAYASFIGFMVYQMDVKSAFLYVRIEEEVYVCQPSGFEDLDHPDKVYKVVKALYGLHQASRAWYKTLAKYLWLQVKQKEDGIFISQDKYVAEVLRKLNFLDVKSASTLVDTKKTLVKDADGDDVDVHLYRSMIGSLMYLIVSRLDIMYAVCVCARFQVTPKVSHLHAVKRIFRYLIGHLKLGLWYPRDSLFELVAYTDSGYARASLDRKSTTRGCQFLGSRLISWQFKKQTVVATSKTEAEYVTAASCCGQVL